MAETCRTRMHSDERHSDEGFTDIALGRDETPVCARSLQEDRTGGNNNLFHFARCWQILRMLGRWSKCAVVPAREQIAQTFSGNSVAPSEHCKYSIPRRNVSKIG
jgi:hypothetical protein